eukprot:TRINITY_DN21317_c0_g1_i2.p1 TRINITY_DN21317_c0_g1~~TRINITY_DN21317_c0_g1_i2.p1  ORF type:complete len:170 (-),score=7.10 TRINITY_DN21317_c0_g1_i2:95-604(-)
MLSTLVGVEHKRGASATGTLFPGTVLLACLRCFGRDTPATGSCQGSPVHGLLLCSHTRGQCACATHVATIFQRRPAPKSSRPRTVSLLLDFILANAVLPVRMARSVERPGQLGPALGWGLLAGGLGQVIGLRLGPLLFVRSSWLGVTSSALLACLAGWYCSTEAPVPRA